VELRTSTIFENFETSLGRSELSVMLSVTTCVGVGDDDVDDDDVDDDDVVDVGARVGCCVVGVVSVDVSVGVSVDGVSDDVSDDVDAVGGGVVSIGG